jgi:hypothetical protein
MAGIVAQARGEANPQDQQSSDESALKALMAIPVREDAKRH